MWREGRKAVGERGCTVSRPGNGGFAFTAKVQNFADHKFLIGHGTLSDSTVIGLLEVCEWTVSMSSCALLPLVWAFSVALAGALCCIVSLPPLHSSLLSVLVLVRRLCIVGYCSHYPEVMVNQHKNNNVRRNKTLIIIQRILHWGSGEVEGFKRTCSQEDIGDVMT